LACHRFAYDPRVSLSSPSGPSPSAPRQVIRSPEQVALELPIAGPSSRVFAFLIDFGLMLVAQGLIAAAVLYGVVSLFDLREWLGVGENGSYQFDAQIDEASASRIWLIAQAIFVLVQFAVQWGYFVCFELLMQGRSPGKAVAGLRVVRDDGLPVGLRESAIRNLLRIVDMLPTAYLVGLVAMVMSRDGKRLGDLAAGTLVVREDRPRQALPIDLAPAGSESVFRFDREQLRALGSAEIRLARQTLRRLEGLPPDRCDEVLARATEALCERMAYLEEVAAHDRRAFLMALLRAAEEAR
jgi:uncharacterized RDD family membrane protein YckC